MSCRFVIEPKQSIFLYRAELHVFARFVCGVLSFFVATGALALAPAGKLELAEATLNTPESIDVSSMMPVSQLLPALVREPAAEQKSLASTQLTTAPAVAEPTGLYAQHTAALKTALLSVLVFGFLLHRLAQTNVLRRTGRKLRPSARIGASDENDIELL